MLEKWKKDLVNKEAFGALFTDLWKAFDCLSHELFTAKLHAYGLFLSLIHDYLLNSKQRTTVTSKYSSCADILEGLPQGPILRPCDLLIIIDTTYFSSYADDNTPYLIKNTVTEVLQELETVSKKLFIWLSENEMMANVGKCYLLLSSVEDDTIEINRFAVKNSHCEKLLGVHFDDQLKFDFHIEKLCKNANRKLHALARVTPYMDLSQKRI